MYPILLPRRLLRYSGNKHVTFMLISWWVGVLVCCVVCCVIFLLLKKKQYMVSLHESTPNKYKLRRQSTYVQVLVLSVIIRVLSTENYAPCSFVILSQLVSC